MTCFLRRILYHKESLTIQKFKNSDYMDTFRFCKIFDITFDCSWSERKIKEVLSTSYEISESDFDKIEIRIKNVSVGVGSMIDDHAISLSIIKPQVYPKDNQ